MSNCINNQYLVYFLDYILFGMRTIYENKSVVKDIKKIPLHVREHYELWKRIVELEGLKGLRLIKGFHDEALRGEWAGYRSSRLSRQWRVIYKAESKVLEVYVIDITPHDYRRG